MRKTRTFIAIVADGEVRNAAEAAIDRLRSAAEDVKWVTPENLHWTLQFLGDLDDGEVAQVCRRVAESVANFEPFVLRAQGVSAFPNPSRPRTIFLGAGSGSDPLSRLQAAVEAKLDDLGFRTEARLFIPHLTLGRVGRGGRGADALVKRLAKLGDYEAGAMEVRQVTVYASQLRRGGPKYHVLANAALGERAD